MNRDYSQRELLVEKFHRVLYYLMHFLPPEQPNICCLKFNLTQLYLNSNTIFGLICLFSLSQPAFPHYYVMLVLLTLRHSIPTIVACSFRPFYEEDVPVVTAKCTTTIFEQFIIFKIQYGYLLRWQPVSTPFRSTAKPMPETLLSLCST